MTIEELAEIMHDKLCTLNHIDYCAWHYRVKDPNRWNEPYSAHQRYLEKANKVVANSGMKLEDIAKVIKAL